VRTLYPETEILEKAVEKFRDTTGLNITVVAEQNRDHAGRHADAVLRVGANDIHREFVAEIKTRLTQATLGAAVLHLKNFPQKGLIVAEYVNPNMADRLKEMDVAFMDTAGNAYLNEPPLFIFVKGNRPEGIPGRRTQTRAFQPTGLKVIFALLCQPPLINAPYRDIAKAANVALGTVGWVFTDLREAGYLIDMGGRGRRLADKKKLIDRWTTAYPEKLRPKLLLGRYMADQPEWWENAKLHNLQACWGGEVAAAKMTQYLRPQLVTIYTREKPAELILENRLRKDPNGNVEILKVFWEKEYNRPHPDLAPPLLVYADLLATGDARNIETAGIIYDQEITRLVGEDR
jgi:hypothetical protein